ncbi:hypothetical protein ISCGN_008089 [Ixodes scapularis]
MRSSTVLSAAALTLVFLAVKSGPMQARAAVILPLILVKKHPLKHDHEHLKKLLQFVNVDAIKGLVGQLINFDAVLRHLAPSNGQMTKREPPRMMSDQPWDVPATLPPIPATPTPETDTSPSESSGCAEGSARCPTSVALVSAITPPPRVPPLSVPVLRLKLIPVPLPLPLPIPIPIHKPKLLHLLLPKLPRIGITVHLGKHGHLPLHHLRLHHKPKLVHVDHHHHEPEFHASHHSSEDEVYEVKTPPQYPNKDWKS